MTAPVPADATTAAEEHVLHRITMWRTAANPESIHLSDLALTSRRQIIADTLEVAAPHIRDALIAEIEPATQAILTVATDRAEQLHQLAADILATYRKRDDGYRGRVGQVQIQRWQTILNGQQ